MKRLIVIASLHNLTFIALLIAVLSINATAQWTEVTLPRVDPLTPLVAIEWPDSATGYVFDMRGYYYKTIDGGDTWKADSLKPMPYNEIPIVGDAKGLTVRTVDFITADFGIVTLEHDPPRGLDSVLYTTTDGGRSWTNKKLNLKNHSKRGDFITTEYSQIRIKSHDHWYLHYMYDDYVDRVAAEPLLFSSDMGESWVEMGIDTLGEFDRVSAMSFIAIDSLHHYKFYYFNHGDGEGSWTKMTTDGGKTWDRITDTSHPLATEGGSVFRNIHTINDTGMAVTINKYYSPLPGIRLNEITYGIATKDIRYRDTKGGWISFSLPWSGSFTRDILYLDGYVYALTTSNAPFGLNDTTWIINAVNGKVRGLLSPIGISSIIPSSRNMIWAIQGYNKIFKLDRRLVSVEETKEPPKTGSLRVFPNPFGSATKSGNQITSISYTLPEAQHVRLSVIDLLGREVAVLVNKEETDGKHIIEFNGDGLCSGVYQLVLMAGEKVVTLKMNLVK